MSTSSWGRVSQETHLVALTAPEEHSTAELADLLGVARSTVYRAIDRDNWRRSHRTVEASG